MPMKSRQACRHKANSGFTIIEMMVVLSVIGLLATAWSVARVYYWRSQQASAWAYQNQEVYDAIAAYVRDKYSPLTAGTAVTGFAQPMAPTVNELSSGGAYLPSGFVNTSVVGVSYTWSLTLSPASCVPSTCNIVWSVRTTAAPLAEDGKVNITLVADAANKTARDAGWSTLENPGFVTNAGASWSMANPAGNVPGIIYLRGDFAATNFAQFVRLNDNRDPNLQGNLSVMGTIRSTSATGTMDGSNCMRAVMMANGQVITRRADCSTSIVLDPNTSQITQNDAAGTTRLATDGLAGALSLRSSSGAAQLALASTGGLINAYEATGTAATVQISGTNGRVAAQRAQLTTSAAAGTSCATSNEGDVVLDSDPTSGVLVCRSNVWIRSGLKPATAGGACIGSGLGQDSNGTAFICRNSVWTALSDRLSRSTFMARYLVQDGTAVPNPTCPTGAVAAIIVTPQETEGDNTGTPARNRFGTYATAGTGQWTISMRLYDVAGTGYSSGFNGSAYNLVGIAQTFCDFPS